MDRFYGRFGVHSRQKTLLLLLPCCHNLKERDSEHKAFFTTVQAIPLQSSLPPLSLYSPSFLLHFPFNFLQLLENYRFTTHIFLFKSNVYSTFYVSVSICSKEAGRCLTTFSWDKGLKKYCQIHKT